jgi:phage terminase large subunit-like protein
MPRKNGKSFLAACIALYALCADDEAGAEVYCVAGDEKQARIVFSYARRMVELDPRLRGVIQVYRDRLWHQDSDSTMEPLAADADLRQGLNPSLTLFDEIHVQPDEDLWLAMQLAMGSRERPLLLGITTPGFDKDSLAWRLREHGRTQNDGDFYFKEFAADEGCDVRDLEQWATANPALDDFLYSKDMAASVKSTPEHAFRRFRLGQWTHTASAWLPFGKWDERADAARIVDKPIVMAFDGSASGDSTALVGATVEPRPHVFVIEMWENPGHHDDPGWRVPRREVDAAVAAAFDRYDVCELACDPWGWRSEIEVWAERHSAVLEWPTNVQSRMGPATDRFYQSVMEDRMTHDGDSRLAKHIANAVTRRSTYGDLIVKDKRWSTRKIDAAVAAVVAVDRAAFHAGKKPKRARVVAW